MRPETLPFETSSLVAAANRKAESPDQTRSRAKQELELYAKDGKAIRARLEAVDEGKFTVKGLFLGMQLTDCDGAFQPHLGEELYLAREHREEAKLMLKADLLRIYRRGQKIGEIRADLVTKKVKEIILRLKRLGNTPLSSAPYFSARELRGGLGDS